VHLCFVWISEQTAIISLYSINWLVFITRTESVYYAVRAGTLRMYMLLILTPGFKALQTASQTVCHQLPPATTHIHRSEIPLAPSMKANNRTAQPAYNTEWHYTVTGHGPGQTCLIQTVLFRVTGIGVVLVLYDGKYEYT